LKQVDEKVWQENFNYTQLKKIEMLKTNLKKLYSGFAELTPFQK
jgi:hypothetical protein